MSPEPSVMMVEPSPSEDIILAAVEEVAEFLVRGSHHDVVVGQALSMLAESIRRRLGAVR